MAIIWLVLLFNLFAFPLTNGLLPYVARDVYHVDQSGPGLPDRQHLLRRHARRRAHEPGHASASCSRADDRVAPSPGTAAACVFAQMQRLAGGIVALLVVGVAKALRWSA